jgi:hypothetical protein
MKLEQSYLMTMSLLVLHQIDAAYWKEWEMFYLPGGIQVFLLFNILIIPVIFIGYKNIIIKSSTATTYSYLCGGLGIITFLIHLGFSLFGATQFHLPLSVAIIILCLIFGIWQIALTKMAKL